MDTPREGQKLLDWVRMIPPQRKAHPAPCPAKAAVRPLSPGGKMGLMCCWFRLSEALACSGYATPQITDQNCPPGPLKPSKLGCK